jgi:hypothetical protein
MVDIPEDTKSRALLNQLTDLIDKLKTTDARDKSGGFGVGVNDVTNSGDFKELTALVEENHGIITEDTDILKKDATTNKVANQLQIAKEIINITQQKTAKVFFDQQRKHNQGAKYSRIRIEDQNAQIIAQNELIIESIPRIIEAVEGGAGTPQGPDPDIPPGRKKGFKGANQKGEYWTDTSRVRNEPQYKDPKTGRFAKAPEGWEPEASTEAEPEPVPKIETPLGKVNAKQSWKKARANFPKRGPGIPGDPTVFHKPGEQAVDFEDKVYNEQAERWIDPETGRFAKEPGEAIAAIAGDARAGMGYAGGTLDRGASEASRGAAVLSKNMGANAPAIQKGMEALEKADKEQAAAAQKELTNLAKMMTARALGEKYGDQNVSIEDVRVQSKRVQGVMGSQGEVGAKLVEDLGLRDVDSSLSERGFTTAVKNFAGVDSGAGFGKGLRQAFTAERMFGKDSKIASAWNLGERAIAGTGNVIGGMFGMKKKFDSRTIEDRVADEKAEQQLATEAQQKGFQGATGEKGLDILQRDETAQELEADAGEDKPVKEAGKKKDKRTGQDTESFQEKQLEVLIEIRNILERGAGGRGGGGIAGTAAKVGIGAGLWAGAKKLGGKAGTALKGVGPASQAFAQGTGGGIMKQGLRGLTRFGGAIAGVGMGVYEGVTGFRDAEARADAGELTAEEEQIAKGEAIGGGTGGASGAIAGAAAGAAIGSIVPVIGTAIGGLVGGAVGYFAGRWAGKKAGGAIADAIPVSAEQLAESNELAETTLENVGERDPALVATIRQEAKQIEAQMLEEAGDEVSDDDKAAITNAGLVKAIQNHTAEIDALPEPTDATQSPGAKKWDKQAGLVAAGADLDDEDPDDIDLKNDLTRGGAVGIARDMGFTNEEIASPGGPLRDYQMTSGIGSKLGENGYFYGSQITRLGGQDVSQEQRDKFGIQKKFRDSSPDALYDETTWGDWGKSPEALASLNQGIDFKTPTPIGKKRGADSNLMPLNRVDAFSNTDKLGMPLNKGRDKRGGDKTREFMTTRRTQKISGTFSERDLARDNPEAYKEFQEIKKKYRGDRMASTKAINEWGRMGRTEGFSNIERSQDGQIVPEGQEMDDLSGSLEPITLPTGDAIDNMTDLAAQTTAETPATVVVANQLAPAPAPSDDGPNIALLPTRVRTSDSVWQRYQDKRFRV